MQTRKAAGKFPLWLHPAGQWCKKHKGQFHYFGTDKDAALKRYVEEWPAIQAGKPPPPKPEEVTVKAVMNTFLTRKRAKMDAGELTSRMWSDYHAVCEAVVDCFGRDHLVMELRPDDFAKLRAAAGKRLGPVALGVFVQRVRTIFRFAYDSRMIAAPIHFGLDFVKPARRVVRRERTAAGPKMLAAADIRKLIEAAGTPLEAMLWLGINCGLGQGDISELPKSALDLSAGWMTFPRPKTGIGRRAPLWPETVEALKAAIAKRPDAKDPAHEQLVFLTRLGQPWVRFKDRGTEKRGARSDAVGRMFGKLVEATGVEAPGGFYVFRHVHRTIADEVRDPVAAGVIMGHDDPSMAGTYREGVRDERLRAVTDHVREWLLAGKPVG